MLTLKPLLRELTIKTWKSDLRPLDLDFIDPDPTIGDWGWAQREFVGEIERQHNAGLPVRIITLKARQLGISTVSEAVMFLWAFFYPGIEGAVISHTDGQAQSLFEKTKLFWKHWPYNSAFKSKYNTRRQLTWEETGSNFRVITANNIDALRGSTISTLHASEIASWPDAETLWGGLEPSIPNRHGTFVCLESTAKGVGNWFHEEWQRAEVGDSAFTPIFFPWYRHPATRIFGTTLQTVDLFPEERELLAAIRTHETEETALAALAFRRVEIRKKGEDWFHQEYPSTAEEAFLTSGRPIFPPQPLKECFDERPGSQGRLYRNGRGEVVFQRDNRGPYTIFAPPHPDPNPNRYFVGGDPAETHTGDPACMQVINRMSLRQVACYHGHPTPGQFATDMMLLGDFYGGAMLCPEVEGGGTVVIDRLLQTGYPNIWNWKKPDIVRANQSNTWGWLTSYQTKRWAIGTLRTLIMDRSIVLHDRRTYQELLNFVEHPNGDLGNLGRMGHDDTVMALAIAVTASIREGHFNPRHSPTTATPDIYTSELETSLSDGGLIDLMDYATRRWNERAS